MKAFNSAAFSLSTCFRVYYDEYADDDGVDVYEKGGVCDSEDEGDVED